MGFARGHRQSVLLRRYFPALNLLQKSLGTLSPAGTANRSLKSFKLFLLTVKYSSSAATNEQMRFMKANARKRVNTIVQARGSLLWIPVKVMELSRNLTSRCLPNFPHAKSEVSLNVVNVKRRICLHHTFDDSRPSVDFGDLTYMRKGLNESAVISLVRFSMPVRKF